MSDLQHKYSGFTGAVRLLWEGLQELPRDFREWAAGIASVLLGRADPVGDSCELRDCDATPVGHYDRLDKYGELDICRKHWVGLFGATILIKALIFGALIGVPIALGVVLSG